MTAGSADTSHVGNFAAFDPTQGGVYRRYFSRFHPLPRDSSPRFYLRRAAPWGRGPRPQGAAARALPGVREAWQGLRGSGIAGRHGFSKALWEAGSPRASAEADPKGLSIRRNGRPIRRHRQRRLGVSLRDADTAPIAPPPPSWRASTATASSSSGRRVHSCLPSLSGGSRPCWNRPPNAILGCRGSPATASDQPAAPGDQGATALMVFTTSRKRFRTSRISKPAFATFSSVLRFTSGPKLRSNGAIRLSITLKGG